jgi:hypothetical protein
MPPQCSSTSSLQRDAGGGQMHAGLVDPARHREAAQALAAAPALAGEPSAPRCHEQRIQYSVSTLFTSVGRPKSRLCDEGRAMARLARLAFERFDQRRFLAADVGAGAAAQHDVAGRGEAGGLELGDRLAQHGVQAGVLVAQVDVDRAAASTAQALTSAPSRKRCGACSR